MWAADSDISLWLAALFMKMRASFQKRDCRRGSLAYRSSCSMFQLWTSTGEGRSPSPLPNFHMRSLVCAMYAVWGVDHRSTFCNWGVMTPVVGGGGVVGGGATPPPTPPPSPVTEVPPPAGGVVTGVVPVGLVDR